MSKTLIVFCLLAVMAVANAQRKLDCEGAKQLYGNRCCLMCNCVGLGGARQECIKQCNDCVAGCNQKEPTFDKCKAVSAIESKVQSCLAEFDSKSKEGEKALKEAMDKYAKDKDGKTVC